MDKNWSRISDGVEDPLPLGLVDIAECEALIQENKSEKYVF